MAMDFPDNPNDGDTYIDNQVPPVTWTYSSDTGWARPPINYIGDDPFVFGDQANDNISVGIDPLTVTGTKNTIVGMDTGQFLATGEKNVIVGTRAGQQVALGKENTLIGYQAGWNLLHGNSDGNVIIGNEVVGSFQQLLNCVVIGNGARPKTDGDSNSIVIGWQAIGDGPDTVTIGTSSSTATYLYGNVHFVDNPVNVKSYLVGELPAATTPGQIIWVSDSTAVVGGVHCSSNGTDWVIMGTATPVT